MNSQVHIDKLIAKKQIPEEISKKVTSYLESFFKNSHWSIQEIIPYLWEISDETNFHTTKKASAEWRENEISYQLSEKFIENICLIKLPILLKNILEKRIQTPYPDKKIYKNIHDFSSETGQRFSLQNSLEKNILLIEDFIQNFWDQFDNELLSQILVNLKEEHKNLWEYQSQTQKISEFIKNLTLQTEYFPEYLQNFTYQAYEILKSERKELLKKQFIQKEKNTIQTYKKVEKILENTQSNPEIMWFLSNFKYQIFWVFLLWVWASVTYDHFTKDPETPYISKQEFQKEFQKLSEKMIFTYASISSSREEFEKHLREHTKDLNKNLSSDPIETEIYIVWSKIMFSVKEEDEYTYIFEAPIPEKFITPLVAETDEKTKIQEDIQKIVNNNSKTKSLEKIVSIIEKSPVILENSKYDFYVKYEIDPKDGPRISVQIKYKKSTRYFTKLYFYTN